MQASSMTRLDTSPHLERADDFYEALIEAHRDLGSEQSQALNARLVLLLANHIGSFAVLQEALALARANTLQGAVGASPREAAAP